MAEIDGKIPNLELEIFEEKVCSYNVRYIFYV